MSNFTVSARKYRPETFKSVVGQEHITNTLKNAIKNDHLAHSFLFTGPRGVGKTTCARILAKTINCENLTEEGEACNECASCERFHKQQSLNIYELDAASNNTVDDIRQLADQVRFGPQSGKYKVYIIDEVHMLSQSAFNAFLKTLEEPPPYAIFILATTEKHKIIPTILSRCQIFDFSRIQVKDIFENLKNIAEQEGIQAEDEALHIIAQKADGALRDALSLYDRIISFSGKQITYQEVIDNLNILDYEYFFKMTNYILEEDLSNALLLFNEILSNGFDGHLFLVGLSEHFRNLLVCKDEKTLDLIEVTENTQKLYQEQAQKVSSSLLLTGLNILNQFDVDYKSSKNQRLHVELALMKLCHINNALSLATAPQSEAKEESSAKKKVAAESAEKQQSTPSNEPESQNGKQAKSSKLGNLNSIKSKIAEDKSASPQQGENGQANKEDAEDTAKQEEKSKNGKIVTKEEFLEVWKEFLEKSLTGRFLYSSLSAKDPVFTDEETVEITVENRSLLKAFEEEKIKLNQLLEERLNNPSIKFDCKVQSASKEEQKKYLVNPKEKFQTMAESNPNLKELQKRLGLQIDQ